MRLRGRARVSAAPSQCALIRCRCKLRLDLSNLLPDKIHHKTRAGREMPARWIDQVERKTGSGKVAQHANQRAIAEVIEDFDQSETSDAVSGARSQMHRAYVVGEKSARYPEILSALRRDKGPHVRIRPDVVHDAGGVFELGRTGGLAVSLAVARRCDGTA